MIPFLGIFGGIGWPELLVIGLVVLLVFGPRRLPEIAEAFGNSIRKFRKATHDVQDEVRREIDTAKDDAEHLPEGRPTPPALTIPAPARKTERRSARAWRPAQGGPGVNLAQLLDRLRADESFVRNVTRWEVLPPRPARLADPPRRLHPDLVAALRAPRHRPAVRPPGRGDRAGGAARALRRGHADRVAARPSATTCRCSTRSCATRRRAPSTCSRPRRSARTRCTRSTA